MEIHKEVKWMQDDRIRMMFCLHPLAPLDKIRVTLPRLKLPELNQVAKNKGLRKPVLDQAKQLLKSR